MKAGMNTLLLPARIADRCCAGTALYAVQMTVLGQEYSPARIAGGVKSIRLSNRNR